MSDPKPPPYAGKDKHEKEHAQNSGGSKSKDQATFTLNEKWVRREYAAGRLDEAGRNCLLQQLGIQVDLSETIEQTLEKLAIGDLTVKGAQRRLKAAGYEDFVLDSFPEIAAALPRPGKPMWSLSMPEPWATFLKQGTINVNVFGAEDQLDANGAYQWRNKVRLPDGCWASCLSAAFPSGSLVEVDGRPYRVISPCSTTAEKITSCKKDGQPAAARHY